MRVTILRLLTLAFLVSVGPLTASIAAQIEEDPDLPGLGNKLDRLEWLQDAGFGLFIHFSHDSQIGSGH